MSALHPALLRALEAADSATLHKWQHEPDRYCVAYGVGEDANQPVGLYAHQPNVQGDGQQADGRRPASPREVGQHVAADRAQHAVLHHIRGGFDLVHGIADEIVQARGQSGLPSASRAALTNSGVPPRGRMPTTLRSSPKTSFCRALVAPARM